MTEASMLADAHESVARMWTEYRQHNPDVGDGPPDYWHFCDNAADADSLADLVLAGRKCATASCLWEYEAAGESPPEPGQHVIVTDFSGRARCIIRFESVEVRPYESVDDAFAAAEGEGDGSLATWRRLHWEYFSRVLPAIGRAPASDMPICCEAFRRVWPVADRMAAKETAA